MTGTWRSSLHARRRESADRARPRMIQSAKQRIGPEASLYYVSTNVPAAAQAAHQSGERAGPVTPLNDDTSASGQSRDGSDVDGALTALYREHALSLIRLAHVMLGDKATAEDVVQEAFCGLYRHWGQLSDPRKAPQYLRASVLNGCRTAIRRDRSARQLAETESTAASAEAAAPAREQPRILMH